MSARDSQARRRRRGGFTIVELMLTVAIIGLAAGATKVAWETMIPRTKLNTAVRELASRLWTCRSDAIARNAEFLLCYDLDEDRYWVLSPYTSMGGFARTFEERLVLSEADLLPDVGIEQVVINETVYDSGVVQIAFRPNGTATGHTVLLKQEQFDRLFTLELLALTGLIRFHDGEFQRELPRDSDFK